MVEVSALQSWTYIYAALVGLRTSKCFNLGLINGEFGTLLPLLKDLYQRVLCFAAKVAI